MIEGERKEGEGKDWESFDGNHTAELTQWRGSRPNCRARSEMHASA